MADVAFWGYGFAALGFFLFALYVFFAWRGGLPGGLLFVAVVCSFLWALAGIASAHTSSGALTWISMVLDVFRGGAWFLFLIVLMRPLWPGGMRWPAILGASTVLAQVLGLIAEYFGDFQGAAMRPVLVSWLAHAVVGLILVEHLYRALPGASRWGIKPLCIALGAGYIFELYLFADATLFSRIDGDVWAVRGLAHATLIPLIALSGSRNPSWTLRMAMSREMVFHSTALAAAGLYLLVIAAVAYCVRYFGGDWGRALQLSLLFAGLVLLGALLFSGSQRARLKVFLSKHLFSYRYDYRNEWLRFTQALAMAGKGLDLGQSVIKALSDLVESPGGTLWLRDSYGKFAPFARLNWPPVDVVEAEQSDLCRFLSDREWVINLEEYRVRPQPYGGLVLPEWLSTLGDAWLVIPLKSSETLVGFVVLSVPRAPFEIDWEVLDLLKTAQRQAAGYLERMLAAEALLEARKFDSFNRMSAFVVHDLKNLVAQLSLMLKNAERHWSNPEFQKDMLETVAHVEGRMRGLMIQLQEKRPIDPPRVVDVVQVLRNVCQSKRGQLPEVELVEPSEQQAQAKAHPERLERIVGHVVQNAIDATDANGEVRVSLEAADDVCLRIVVEDSGCGMSADFLRDRLSRPFQTTKSSGMGIGVFETRQYLNEIGGDLRFESEVGRGTRVTIQLPRATLARATTQDGASEIHAG
ncbi:XrtA/PEP-CTERM system histidine kinase PrsK [Thauera sp.]|uniref:XrtA/PEP-CTERM system histidine kinase PrsK n=1 Tax=Thauera sp. TaxID=1905334 RepID=UPI00257F343C|nr:XrtA/PEP-CTERM system histidine kinase PrsK [Thauera sp.]